MMQSQVVRLGLLIVVPLAIFVQIVAFQFVNLDDPFNIDRNPLLNPVRLGGLVGIWNSSYFGLYIPVTYSFWWLLGAISHFFNLPGPAGFNPGLFHAASLALHIGCVLATYRLLRLIVPEVTPWGACLGALLVAVHPLQVETIAWVTETKGLLATLFSLLALGDWALCQQLRQTPVKDESAPRPRGPEMRSTIFLVLALLSKPAAVAVPLVAICIDWLLWRKRLTDAVRNMLDWLVMAVVIVLVTRYVQPTGDILPESPLWERPLIAVDALGFYLTQLVAPWQQTVDYGRTPQWVSQSGTAYWMWLIPAAVLAIVLWLRNPVPRTALAIFVVWLLPVLGLLPFQFQLISTVADRYMYPAMLGPAMIVAWIASRYGRPAYIGLTAVLIAFGGLAFAQARVWQDSITLFAHAVEVHPQSDSALTNLATAYLSLGDRERAAEFYQRAIEAGQRAEPRAGMAGLLIDDGELDRAEELLQEALEINERADGVHASLSRVYRARGAWAEAMEHAQKAFDIYSGQASAATDLAWILAASPDPTIRDGRKALEYAQLGVAQTGGTDAKALATLAAAQAETGDFAAAQQSVAAALSLTEVDSLLHKSLLAQQRYYQNGQPVRETP